MFKRIFDRNKLEISVISCGDTGQALGAELITTLRQQGAKVKSLAITSEIREHRKSKIFDRRVSIDESQTGFAKRFEAGYKAAEHHRVKIADNIKKVIPDEDTGIFLITTGAGATGLGASLVAVEILYEQYKKIPPILTLLPESFENSRVQYNMSMFLYRVAFREDNFGNSVLLLDNTPTPDELELPFSTVSKNRIHTIPQAFADLLFASFENPLDEEFEAKTSDLFEVMHTPGISVFVYEDLNKEGDAGFQTGNLENIIAYNVTAATSLSKEQIYQAKKAFFTLINIDQSQGDLGFDYKYETRKVLREFKESRPFMKIIKSGNKGQQTRDPKLRGILTGIPLPNRILQVMRIAREARKRIMVAEDALSNEVAVFNFDKVMKLEEQLSNY